MTDVLQSICRDYLYKLREKARNVGLLSWTDKTIEDNENGNCKATEEQVAMLSRLCDDERVSRKEIPKILGKSYRQSFRDKDFDKVKTLKRVGIYSKISALLFKSKQSV